MNVKQCHDPMTVPKETSPSMTIGTPWVSEKREMLLLFPGVGEYRDKVILNISAARTVRDKRRLLSWQP